MRVFWDEAGTQVAKFLIENKDKDADAKKAYDLLKDISWRLKRSSVPFVSEEGKAKVIEYVSKVGIDLGLVVFVINPVADEADIWWLVARVVMSGIAKEAGL